MNEPRDNFTLCKFMSDILKEIKVLFSARKFKNLRMVAKVSLEEFDLIVVELDGRQEIFKDYEQFLKFVETWLLKD